MKMHFFKRQQRQCRRNSTRKQERHIKRKPGRKTERAGTGQSRSGKGVGTDQGHSNQESDSKNTSCLLKSSDSKKRTAAPDYSSSQLLPIVISFNNTDKRKSLCYTEMCKRYGGYAQKAPNQLQIYCYPYCYSKLQVIPIK